MKKCSKCGKELDVSEFYVTAWGYRGDCKKCFSESSKKYRQMNRVKITAAKKKYRETHRDEMRKYFRDHKEDIKRGRHLLRAKNPQQDWAKKTIRHHKATGLYVSIDLDELTELAYKTTRCPICDTEFSWLNTGPPINSSPSLDRKYNGDHISIETCWIICHRCNSMKRDMPMPELIGWCKNIIGRFDKQEGVKE
jgi:hypothetical protein